MSRGWIAVDFDGTLAHYDEFGDGTHLGAPIKPMVDRVKRWLEKGKDVRIFTARVGNTGLRTQSGNLDGEEFAANQVKLIQAWCLEHIGKELPVTATKDFGMIALFDDRAVQVIHNTGELVERD